MNTNRFTPEEIESAVIRSAAEVTGIDAKLITADSRFVQDLHCDSLEFVELLHQLETQFSLTLPDVDSTPIAKSFFTQNPFRVRDLAELLYIYQGVALPAPRKKLLVKQPSTQQQHLNPFTQLSGRWDRCTATSQPLFRPLSSLNKPNVCCRRQSDGMRCVIIPAATVEIGSNSPDAQADQQPLHSVSLDSFVIDREPVSTTAYCRFLNSIDGATDRNYQDWFALDETDSRNEQLQIHKQPQGWQPLPGTEFKPMVLVSWFGANAYSLWANGLPWKLYLNEAPYLPSEAQWEYAARGVTFSQFPWNEENGASPVICGLSEPGMHDTAQSMPLADVNEPYGMSPFGLHHMAGNIWQWCSDWYAPDFYQTSDSTTANPVNRNETGLRSERGGSWVGPIELCSSSYRRGRDPMARGRCLGFRCLSDLVTVNISLENF